MTKIYLKGKDIHTFGSLPDVGSIAHDFTFTKSDLSDINLYSYKGNKILNVFPSIDTGTCAMSVRTFSKDATDFGNTTLITLSMDLPFALTRFCGAEGIKNIETGSLFRSDFFKHYPLQMIDGPLRGLCSRVVILINEKNEIKYTEQVAEIANGPNYELLLDALKI